MDDYESLGTRVTDWWMPTPWLPSKLWTENWTEPRSLRQATSDRRFRADSWRDRIPEQFWETDWARPGTEIIKQIFEFHLAVIPHNLSLWKFFFVLSYSMSILSSVNRRFYRILDDPDNALRQAVAETWKSKAFADVEVVCGVDGGTLLSHRIVLVIFNEYFCCQKIHHRKD